MTFEWLVPIKQAEVYTSWCKTLTDLSVSASDLATSSQDKIEEIFRQVSYLNYKSFSNLCGVADWLIINGLNAFLKCASSFIKYNIHVCHVVLWMMDLMNLHGQWNMISLNKKRKEIVQYFPDTRWYTLCKSWNYSANVLDKTSSHI